LSELFYYSKIEN